MLTAALILIFVVWGVIGAIFTLRLNKNFRDKYNLKQFSFRNNTIEYDTQDKSKTRKHFIAWLCLFITVFIAVFLAYFINAIIRTFATNH